MPKIKDSLVVFDSSGLLGLYSMEPDACSTMCEIIRLLSDHIWIPAQVLEEFNRHCEACRTQPIREHYPEKPLGSISNHFTEIDKLISLLDSDTYYHPHINPHVLDSLKHNRAEAFKAFDAMRSSLEREFKKRRDEIKSHAENDPDPILDLVNSLDHGHAFSYSEVLDVIREGELRYRNSIPPGYCDDKSHPAAKSNPKSKTGVDRFGDLIIWKEILRHASKENRNVIFVTNDTKEDTYIRKNDEPAGPRLELIREFHDAVPGRDVHFYTLDQFIASLRKEYPDVLTQFESADLEDLQINLEEHRRYDELSHDRGIVAIVRCDCCQKLVGVRFDDIDWDWEIEETEYRDMGTERHWVCRHTLECDSDDVGCKEDIELEFNIWEYPQGCINFYDLDVSDGILMAHRSFTDKLNLQNLEPCCMCGDRTLLDADGYCEECADYIRYQFEKD